MQAIVAAALRQRILVVILSVALMFGGFFAYKQLNIEAYPDPVPPLVDIVTQNPGQSSEEIERYITIPIEVQMDKGHVIVHGIHPDTGKAYHWVDEPLWEIEAAKLPTITREQENRIGVKIATLLGVLKKGGVAQGTSAVVGPSGLIPDGQRNLYLKDKLHPAAAKVKSREELQDEADLINNTCFEEALSAAEIKKQVDYWWKLKVNGKLLVKGGEPAAFLKTSEHRDVANPNVISLLMILRLSHSYKRGVKFSIVPESMTKIMGIGAKPIRKARDRLIGKGYIRKVGGLGRKHSPFQYILT